MSNAASEAAAALRARLAAEQALQHTAAIARTNFLFRGPSPAEQAVQQRAEAAAADHSARAVLARPAMVALLAQLRLCDQHTKQGPRCFLELAQALVPSVVEFGRAAFDASGAFEGDAREVSKAMTFAAQGALYNFPEDLDVALVAGALIEALSDHNKLERSGLTFESCKSALVLHGEHMGVQRLYREVLRGYGSGSLDQPHLIMVRRALQEARAFMAPPVSEGQPAVPIAPQAVLRCLLQLEHNAHFVLMCCGEHVEFKARIALVAAWCLAGSLREDRRASFCGDLHVARAACVLLYKTAAGCMQLDGECLVEAQRRSLCDLELPQLFFELRQRLHKEGGSPDDAHIEWLFVRLQREYRVGDKRPAAEAFEAPDAPDAPDAPRARGSGGSA